MVQCLILAPQTMSLCYLFGCFLLFKWTKSPLRSCFPRNFFFVVVVFPIINKWKVVGKINYKKLIHEKSLVHVLCTWESLDLSISLVTLAGAVTRCKEILKYWGWDRKHSCLSSGRILIFIIFRPEMKNIIQKTTLGKRHSVHFSFYVQKGKFKTPRSNHEVRT